MGKHNALCVTRKPNESTESLLSRFRQAVDSEGILKDYKLNVLFSREERRKFKKFSNKRRSEKKHKRIREAIDRTSHGGRREGVV